MAESNAFPCRVWGVMCEVGREPASVDPVGPSRLPPGLDV